MTPHFTVFGVAIYYYAVIIVLGQPEFFIRGEDEFGFGESREGERQHKQKGPQHRSEGGEKKTAERVRRHGMSAC